MDSIAQKDSLVATVEVSESVGSPVITVNQSLPGHSSVVIGILVALFVGAGCNPSAFRRSISRYKQDLWSVRQRRNAFDDESDAPLLMMIFLTVGSLIVCGFCGGMLAGAHTAEALLWDVGAFGVFYLFDYIVCLVTGYAFTSSGGATQWKKGLIASVTLTGIINFIPLAFLLFVPELRGIMGVICLLVFFLMRIVYICKGFRIFYSGFPSLLYFILYLCSAEIIPLFALWKIFRYLTDSSL